MVLEVFTISSVSPRACDTDQHSWVPPITTSGPKSTTQSPFLLLWVPLLLKWWVGIKRHFSSSSNIITFPCGTWKVLHFFRVSHLARETLQNKQDTGGAWWSAQPKGEGSLTAQEVYALCKPGMERMALEHLPLSREALERGIRINFKETPRQKYRLDQGVLENKVWGWDQEPMWGAGRLSPPTQDPSFDNQVRNPLNSQHGDNS